MSTKRHARLGLPGFHRDLSAAVSDAQAPGRIACAKPMRFYLPGYVFCRFGLREKLQVLQSPGVRSIVGAGKQPAPVEENEISAVRAVLSSGGAVAPWPYLRIGQSVIIEHGPLAPLRGVILRTKNSWRVVVSVEALGSSVSVELDSDQLSPDRSGCHRMATTRRVFR